MSSPQGGSSPVGNDDTRDDDISPIPEPSTSPASEHVADATSESCRWKTSEFHDQECSRYFDCPSHVVERELSDAHHAEQDQAPAGEGGSSAASQVNDTTEDTTSRSSADGDDGNHGNTQPSDTDHTDTHVLSDLGSASPESHRQSSVHSDSASTTQSAEDDQSETTVLPFPPSSSAASSNPEEPDRDTARVQVQNIPNPRVNWADLESRYRGAYLRAANEEVQQGVDSAPRMVSHTRDMYRSPVMYRRQESSGRRGSQDPRVNRFRGDDGMAPEFMLPRWQPDAEVTYCPICQTQFSFFVRKHHCRYVVSL